MTDLKDIRGFAFDIDGVFTDGGILALPNGDLLRTFNSKDCFAVRMAVDMGFCVAIITGGCSESIIHRAETLGVKPCNLFQFSKDKAPDLETFCSRNGLTLSEVAFVGDDLPDVPAILAAGIGVCPSDAVREAKEAADYISPNPGGHGCIREFVEKVLRAQDKWNFDPKMPWAGKYPDAIAKFAENTGNNFKG